MSVSQESNHSALIAHFTTGVCQVGSAMFPLGEIAFFDSLINLVFYDTNGTATTILTIEYSSFLSFKIVKNARSFRMRLPTEVVLPWVVHNRFPAESSQMDYFTISIALDAESFHTFIQQTAPFLAASHARARSASHMTVMPEPIPVDLEALKAFHQCEDGSAAFSAPIVSPAGKDSGLTTCSSEPNAHVELPPVEAGEDSCVEEVPSGDYGHDRNAVGIRADVQLSAPNGFLDAANHQQLIDECSSPLHPTLRRVAFVATADERVPQGDCSQALSQSSLCTTQSGAVDQAEIGKMRASSCGRGAIHPSSGRQRSSETRAKGKGRSHRQTKSSAAEVDERCEVSDDDNTTISAILKKSRVVMEQFGERSPLPDCHGGAKVVPPASSKSDDAVTFDFEIDAIFATTEVKGNVAPPPVLRGGRGGSARSKRACGDPPKQGKVQSVKAPAKEAQSSRSRLAGRTSTTAVSQLAGPAPMRSVSRCGGRGKQMENVSSVINGRANISCASDTTDDGDASLSPRPSNRLQNREDEGAAATCSLRLREALAGVSTGAAHGGDDFPPPYFEPRIGTDAACAGPLSDSQGELSAMLAQGLGDEDLDDFLKKAQQLVKRKKSEKRARAQSHAPVEVCSAAIDLVSAYCDKGSAQRANFFASHERRLDALATHAETLRSHKARLVEVVSECLTTVSDAVDVVLACVGKISDRLGENKRDWDAMEADDKASVISALRQRVDHHRQRNTM